MQKGLHKHPPVPSGSFKGRSLLRLPRSQNQLLMWPSGILAGFLTRMPGFRNCAQEKHHHHRST